MYLHNNKHLFRANKIQASFKLILWSSREIVLHTDTIPPLRGVKHSRSRGSIFVGNHLCEDS